MNAGAGDDLMRGSAFDDELRGFRGDDALYGGADSNELFGGSGDDALYGNSGDDTLRGGKDDDSLNGGSGIDRLTGGSGEDVFVFASGEASLGADADVITDFARKVDKIDLSGIPGLTLFVKGGFSGSGDPQAKLKFKKGSTQILIDQDGDGTADMQINVEGVAKLAASDFIL